VIPRKSFRWRPSPKGVLTLECLMVCPRHQRSRPRRADKAYQVDAFTERRWPWCGDYILVRYFQNCFIDQNLTFIFWNLKPEYTIICTWFPISVGSENEFFYQISVIIGEKVNPCLGESMLWRWEPRKNPRGSLMGPNCKLNKGPRPEAFLEYQ
jgi:hypothetical protein